MTVVIRFSVLATLVLCCTSVFAETVEPLGAFDIKNSLSPNHAINQIMVRSFVADNSGLYFLIDVNPEQPILAQSLILHTDSRGTRKKLIQLTPSGFGLYGSEKRQYYDINVDSSGNIYLSQFIIRPKAEENITVSSDNLWGIFGGNTTN